MNCPFCGRAMEKGWLYTSGPLIWTANPAKLSCIAGRGDAQLARTPRNRYDTSPGPDAWICKACRVMITAY